MLLTTGCIVKKPKLKKEKPLPNYVCYTDGSVLASGAGPGGWGSLVAKDGVETKLSGGYKLTTNNRMEIMAVIATLEEYGPNEIFEIHTDSTYVMNGCLFWVKQWARNRWVTFAGTPVKNRDLWMILKSLLDVNDVRVHKVKAHSGVRGNEIADELAKNAASNNPTQEDIEYLKENPIA